MNQRYCADDYSYRVFRSEEDCAYVATVDEFASLSNIDSDMNQALMGMFELLGVVLDDMYANGEKPPAPFKNPTRMQEAVLV